MGRKNRMKSTFANQVSPGTFWIRHNSYGVLINQKYTKLEKDDVVVVLGFLNDEKINIVFKDIKIVKCYSQKMNGVYTTDLEKFYFNYHKL